MLRKKKKGGDDTNGLNARKSETSCSKGWKTKKNGQKKGGGRDLEDFMLEG